MIINERPSSSDTFNTGANANGPLWVGCQLYFHLNLFNFFFYYKIFCGSARKKIKHFGLATCVGIWFFVLSVMFCLIVHCQVVVLNVLSAGLLTIGGVFSWRDNPLPFHKCKTYFMKTKVFNDVKIHTSRFEE